MTPSQAKRQPKAEPSRAKRERYDVRTRIDGRSNTPSGRPISCGPTTPRSRIGFPCNSPSRATEVRKTYGLEGAQLPRPRECICHSEVYAEQNFELAVMIARLSG